MPVVEAEVIDVAVPDVAFGYHLSKQRFHQFGHLPKAPERVRVWEVLGHNRALTHNLCTRDYFFAPH